MIFTTGAVQETPNYLKKRPVIRVCLSRETLRESAGRMATTKKPTKANSALAKPVQPDEILAKVVGSTPLPRTELTKKIWDYIKKNGLQDEKKKTLINADDALKAVFGGKKQVTMFEMTKLVNAHVS